MHVAYCCKFAHLGCNLSLVWLHPWFVYGAGGGPVSSSFIIPVSFGVSCVCVCGRQHKQPCPIANTGITNNATSKN